MPMYTKTGRSLWPLVIGGALVLVAVAVVVLVSLTHREGSAVADPAPSATTAAPTPPPSPSPSPTGTHEGEAGGTPELGDPPTGCLAGPDTDARMVLATQAAAPHTAYGAVEMAASYMRWSIQYPFPDSKAIATVQEAVMARSTPESFRDLAAGYASVKANPAKAGVLAPASEPFGTPFYLSTRAGRWLVAPGSTDDRVTVKLSAAYVIGGELVPDNGPVMTMVVVWENGAWHIEQAENPDPAALTAGGVAYAGGC